MMKIWTCKGFTGMYAVPTAAVVVARYKDEATRLMRALLTENGLDPDQSFILVQVDVSVPHAVMLSNGDY